MKKILLPALLLMSLSAMAFGKKSNDHYDLSTSERVLAAKIELNNAGEFLDANMVPIGSAVLTDSGELYEQGIKGILHAASGSMTRFDGIFQPSLEGITNSLKNSLLLAKNQGFKSVAIPFIGSGIFLQRLGVDKKELAYHIAKASLHNSRNIRIVFVGYSEEDRSLLEEARLRALEEITLKKKVWDFLHFSASASKRSSVAGGSLVDYDVHQCELIINPANTEVSFGGGLSGVIARASRKSYEIDRDAQEMIQEIAHQLNLQK